MIHTYVVGMGDSTTTGTLDATTGHAEMTPSSAVGTALRVVSYCPGKPAEQRWFTRGAELRFGRHKSCDIRLSSDGGTSRFHARVVWSRSDELLHITDGHGEERSSNGTFLNAATCVSATVESRCVLRLGGNVVVLELALDPGERRRSAMRPHDSVAMVDALQELDEAARLQRPLLLSGPTGVGKTYLARRAHERSGRKGPFVSYSAANIPGDSADALLFGAAPRAFTGVDGGPGLIEQANRGTLFLDEIGELPLALQPKLLTCIESGRVRRLRDATERTVDVRLISATNLDLDRAVDDGTFRADLLYRLASSRIRVPALAQRRSEIIGLLCDFIDAARAGSAESSAARASSVYVDTLHSRFQPHALEAIVTYDWAENVRGLVNLADRLAARTEPFALEDLSSAPRDRFLERRNDEATERRTSKRTRRYKGPDVDELASQYESVGRRPMELWRTYYKDQVRPEQVYRWLEQTGLRTRKRNR